MIVRPSVTVDGRDQDALLRELEARQPGYVPEWRPAPRDPGAALQAIVARFAQAVVQRLEQAPEKNKLAFLDMLGQRLSPARAARAPVVFELGADAAGGAAPIATAVAAPPPPGSTEQVVFETERGVGLTPGKLTQVFSLWPGRDEYIDHTADFLAGRAIRLFNRDELETSPHHLYLAHSVLLNLQGNVTLSVEFQLQHPSGEGLEISWEYWDGEVWRGFASLDTACQEVAAQQSDATNGLTVSGVLKLKADCAKSDRTSVNGLSNYWIRGRLTEPMPPDPANPPPEVESIRISSLVSQPLVARLSGAVVGRTPTSPAPTVPLTGGFTLFLFNDFEQAAAPAPPTLEGTLVNEAGHPIGGAEVVLSDPQNPNFGTPKKITTADGKFSFELNNFGAGRDMRFEVTFLGARDATIFKVPFASSEVRLTLKLTGLALTTAYNDGTKLDTTKPFYPFGQQPQPGTVFYFTNSEVFSKPGARFRLYLPRTFAPSDTLTPTDSAGERDGSVTPLAHLVAWEYWNGREWTEMIPNATGVEADFETTEILDFRVPVDLVPVAVNDDPGLWMRARLVSGGYGFFQKLTFRTGASNTDNNFRMLVTQPPILAAAPLGYSWQFGPFHPEAVLTFNDFRYEEHTYEATWPGSFFQPFRTIQDMTPALYLGFDKPAPVADIGLFFDIVERASGEAAPHLTWEYWDGFNWADVPVADETAHLTAPGILSHIAAADSAALARFGQPLFWLRGRLKEDGPPPEVAVAGIHPNAVWALQQRTFADVSVGSSSGQPSQVFRVAQTPIIPGERLEVLELSGARANVEWRLVALELSSGSDERVRRLEALLGSENLLTDIVDGDLRLRRDKQKRVAEVWVRWYTQPNLFFSSPTDRHYAIDRARGIVFFGDGVNGRVPPLGATVNLRRFQSGGGAEGNVAARTITQLLGAVPGVQAVFNPRAAEGGSDGETVEAFRRRAPASVRHGGRALTAADYEAMVREASSAVSVVKAIPNRNPAGRLLPGWLTIFIIPESQDARPYPSRGLRDEVLGYISRRSPAGLASGGYIHVTGPSYFPVDISATIVPEPDAAAGLVEARARTALLEFLHPLHGGPAGEGWEFGRGVYLSDVATVLEAVEGLDYAELIQMLVNEEVRGEFAAVPRDLIVVAGTIRLTVKGARG